MGIFFVKKLLLEQGKRICNSAIFANRFYRNRIVKFTHF